MKYEIFVSDKNNYLNIKVLETVTDDLLKDFIEATAKKSHENKINKFLFNLQSAPDGASTVVHYDFVYEKSKKLGFKAGSKHALLVSLEDRHVYHFVETLLLNAGYQSKIFTREKEAIEWLEK